MKMWTFSYSIAGSAKSSVTFFSKIGIFFCKLMSIFTMSSHAKEFCITKTTKHIFLWSNSFKMIWIYTQSVSAQVINMKSTRNFSFFYFITKSVGILHFFISNTKKSISLGCTSHPIPAMVCFFNFFKKSFNECVASFRHSILIAQTYRDCK